MATIGAPVRISYRPRTRPLYAWRVWTWDGSPELWSWSMENLWPARAPMRADRPIRKSDAAWQGRRTRPSGVFAWRTKAEALAYAGRQRYNVVGRVALWGRVCVHRRGWRASAGRCVALIRPAWLKPDPFRCLVEVYRVRERAA